MKKIFALLIVASALVAAAGGDIPYYPDCHPNCGAARTAR